MSVTKEQNDCHKDTNVCPWGTQKLPQRNKMIVTNKQNESHKEAK